MRSEFTIENVVDHYILVLIQYILSGESLCVVNLLLKM